MAERDTAFFILANILAVQNCRYHKKVRYHLRTEDGCLGKTLSGRLVHIFFQLFLISFITKHSSCLITVAVLLLLVNMVALLKRGLVPDALDVVEEEHVHVSLEALSCLQGPCEVHLATSHVGRLYVPAIIAYRQPIEKQPS